VVPAHLGQLHAEDGVPESVCFSDLGTTLRPGPAGARNCWAPGAQGRSTGPPPGWGAARHPSADARGRAASAGSGRPSPRRCAPPGAPPLVVRPGDTGVLIDPRAVLPGEEAGFRGRWTAPSAV